MVDENALIVLKKRYFVKDEKGTPIETPEDMFRRVARAVAQAEDRYGGGKREKTAEDFFLAMNSLEFLPNSPTLMNAGRKLGQLAACFVLPIDDSLDSIFGCVKDTAKIHQTGGGTGFSFSRLRPKNDIVASTMGAASGPVSFIRVFNIATEVIKQGGTRRGANMGILRIDHPDIEEFITVKRDPQELTNFNLSVAVTDAFMDAYRVGDPFRLINPRTRKEVKTIKAREIFRLIAESAWASGEPGVIFLDTINRVNPTPLLGEMEATNPCGEVPLLPYESCCLGSVNLAKMVKGQSLDWDRLREVTHLGVRFLDNIVDVTRYPLPEIERITQANRKIGLGVMGFAHMLIELGIPYDSAEAERVGDDVMSFVSHESKAASQTLAEERGPFPNFKGSIWDGKGIVQRNATTTTIAPTGTLSIIAGTSSGIEPIYDISYKRILFGGMEVEVTDPLYTQIKGQPDAAETITKLFRTAHQVSPDYHLKIQGAFQKHTDNAVSKTINLPAEATPDTILEIYSEAHRMGLKGVTVFRDRSREQQVLSCGTNLAC